MTGRITLTIIKPTAFRNNHAGAILKMINEAGFQLRALKLLQLTPGQAGLFYSVHKGKPFYESLVKFMSWDRLLLLSLKKIMQWRISGH